MSKILDNTTGSNIVISDTGVTITPSTDYTIPPQDYLLWASSDDIIVHVGNGDIVVNDGSNNLSPSDGMDLIKGLFPNPVGVASGDDRTPIGHVGDRLKVDAALTTIAPSDNIAYFHTQAENGGSSDMAVDGSGTAVEFTVGPPAGEVWYVFEMGVSIEDSGNNTIDNFGAIGGGLTNGVLIEQHINSNSYTFKNLKTNLDIVATFSDHSFRGQGNAYINSSNFFTGKVELREAITLNGDDGDEIHVHVRDDLTGLNKLEFNIEYYRVVS